MDNFFDKVKEIIGLEEYQSAREKRIIEVPEYVNYMSQWREFELPKGHVIIDKQVCGCGFTEYCLTNPLPTIVLSPRKVLLENKEEQHNVINQETGQVEFPVYYFKNEQYSMSHLYDEDPRGTSKEKMETIEDLNSEIDTEEKRLYLAGLKTKLQDYVKSCIRPPKIICTYDSSRHVFDALRGIGIDFSEWSVVVDEMQSIFTDSSFKSDVELNFIGGIQDVPNVCFVSATPMLDRYLDAVDYLRGLPFIKLDWGPRRTELVKTNRKMVESLTSSCCDWVLRYKNGNFPVKTDPDGNIYESRELVIYLNSVNGIAKIIKKAGLTPGECNIICAQSAKNRQKLNKLSNDLGYSTRKGKERFDYGKVPTDPYHNKMFTFCTKTTYIGADFYSFNAMTIICSDRNIDTLNLDISLDLPQILGRQRMKENRFRNEVVYLQQGHSKEDFNISTENFMASLEKKKVSTDSLLKTYSKADTDIDREALEDVYRRASHNYKYNFVGFDSTGAPVMNVLAAMSFVRAFELTDPEYQDKVMMKREDSSESVEYSDMNETDRMLVSSLESEFQVDNNFERRMRLVYEFYTSHQSVYNKYRKYIWNFLPGNFQNYINILGFDKIRANSYKESDILKVFDSVKKKDEVSSAIYSKFEVGERYSLKYIKGVLKEIYNNLGVSGVYMASELEKYFELKECLMKSSSGSRVHGYQILSRKE